MSRRRKPQSRDPRPKPPPSLGFRIRQAAVTGLAVAAFVVLAIVVGEVFGIEGRGAAGIAMLIAFAAILLFESLFVPSRLSRKARAYRPSKARKR